MLIGSIGQRWTVDAVRVAGKDAGPFCVRDEQTNGAPRWPRARVLDLYA